MTGNWLIRSVILTLVATLIGIGPSSAQNNGSQPVPTVGVGGTGTGLLPPDPLRPAASAQPVPLNMNQLKCLEAKVREAIQRSSRIQNGAVMFDGMVFCGQPD